MDSVNFDCLKLAVQLSENSEEISREFSNVVMELPYDDPMNPSSEPFPMNYVIEDVLFYPLSV
ncbi:hypothetical protein PIB30_053233 [Stylosanthes scabra]|uniref:Uncharacterized protein n=1 Tax=Stylosanthes scabra TaxID=79078 RepID=A0ABU6VKU2_9FABA|nr:hypothetical protein [Stylosanthes scabra]